ncbi:MAG: UDP-N-acetylmuramoyl-L-alanyl-D-glutamate--2,6-diaminopimelate ligase [Alphaproteobacteria bacterium]|jgi:UDP-N-acetylmuramoyl-L-alanyl-D-glutamate--2,6-diaminopimelate ligase|nr:UDP-N-acetylmuramoyl-L-alanyl-D-glutamate--2,6-diaminopimelate ligase [Alphaproteobacteria bacterium]MDP7223191.1 UDP-N-acetylmuramoyl-L-alanyl-D-glutamate--2,6-diaminopimelate ligase [Alphaproteobacteria bacterium]
MKLSALYPDHVFTPDPDIRGITADSRAVQDGYLFAALPGGHYDGAGFIRDAVANGAVAVLCAEDAVCDADDVAVLRVQNPRQVLGDIAAHYYAAQPDHIAAVTGTNGKTSTVDFVRQILEALSVKGGSLGTLGVRFDEMDRSGAMTTPDPVTLHALLADLSAAGVTHLAMEASSHGLDQHRLDHVKVDVAAFTNLSHDHLDYHENFENYLAAKMRLFDTVLSANGVAVLNADIKEFKAIQRVCETKGHRVLSYGRDGDTLRLLSCEPRPGGQAIRLEIDGQVHDILIPLVGYFQVMNILCAMAIVMGYGFAVRDIVPVLPSLTGVPGRLQQVSSQHKGAVYIDYAHTPDALEKVLDALRPHTPGRLICLIGCGGDRDPAKRPVMGRIAHEKADIAIITDDNPRTEEAAPIRAAMMAQAPDAIEVAGRREAIAHGVSLLQDGDVFLIAGKGHEQGQIVGDKILPFDDYTVAQDALEGRKA